MNITVQAIDARIATYKARQDAYKAMYKAGKHSREAYHSLYDVVQIRIDTLEDLKSLAV